jgi:hypothetical protein
VLALEITLQCLQHVTGRAFQIIQLPCTVEHHEFAAGNLHDIGWKSLRYFPLGVDGLGKLATVTPDHQANVSRYDTFRKTPLRGDANCTRQQVAMLCSKGPRSDGISRLIKRVVFARKIEQRLARNIGSIINAISVRYCREAML